MKSFFMMMRMNRGYNFLNLLVVSAFFVLMMIAIINFNQGKIDLKFVEYFKDKKMTGVVDTLDHRNEEEFFADNKYYDKLYHFGNVLNDRYDYYITNVQEILVKDFNDNPIFNPGYEYGELYPVYKEDGAIYSVVNSIQLNEKPFEYNNMNIVKGRGFESSEFIFNNQVELPVIIGDELSSYYDIGDIIEIDYYYEKFEGEVVGILAPQTQIITHVDPQYPLDRYIILPSMKLANRPTEMFPDLSESVFPNAMLFSRIGGRVIDNRSALEVKNEIEEIGEETGFREFYVIGTDGYYLEAVTSITNLHVSTVYILIFSILFIMIVTLIFACRTKIKRNINTFMVFLVSGADEKKFAHLSFYELFIILLIGIVVPLPAMYFFSIVIDPWVFIWQYLFWSTTTAILILILGYIYIKVLITRADIVQKLKE